MRKHGVEDSRTDDEMWSRVKIPGKSRLNPGRWTSGTSQVSEAEASQKSSDKETATWSTNCCID